MHIALFFGSFNPIHIGHLSIAQYVLNECGVDEVHFVLSPQNPFKTNTELWSTAKRWDLLTQSIADNPRFKASDIELHLPTPSYTSQTLKHLESQTTGHQYSILMGSDTFAGLSNWKSPEHIRSYPLLVYPRQTHDSLSIAASDQVKVLNSPLLGISATMIRQLLREHKSVRYLVKDEILDLL